MKVLTVITIVMAIPNIIFGFYGMNVNGPSGRAVVVVPDARRDRRHGHRDMDLQEKGYVFTERQSADCLFLSAVL